MITAFTGSITKILVDGKQVYPGDQKAELPAGKTFTVGVHYTMTAAGDLAWNDYWTVGVTCKIGSQFGWDPTSHRGSGQKTGTPEIGNLKAPSGKATLGIRLFGIDAINPSAPPAY